MNDIQNYRRIRKSIGVLGISLPIILLLFSCLHWFNTIPQKSISHYYYTNLRELFTGILCSTGLFLLRYKGFGNTNFFKNDSLLTNIAGLMAFGIALFPTDPIQPSDKIYSLFQSTNPILGSIHFILAGIFFIILANLSINVFTIGSNKTDSLIHEDNIYKVCGYTIYFCIVMLVLFHFVIIPYTIILFETIALFAFGISWLVKGRVIDDKGSIGMKVYGK